MKTHQKQKQVSHPIQSKNKATSQAPSNQILQRYHQKTIQKEALDEEDLLQGKFETVQREEWDEDELLQGKFQEPTQRMESDELDEEDLLQGKFQTIQREELEDDELLQGKFAEPTQLESSESTPSGDQGIETDAEGEAKVKPNNTGLPDNLKTGIENLSGYSMDDVNVHYNSNKPAQLQALAYTQGTDIHVAPGQEKHLPHEAWHVVQQKQGRVQPTMQLQGVNVNDNESLEREADVMGNIVVQKKSSKLSLNIIQFFTEEDIKKRAYYIWLRKGRPNQGKDQQDKDYFEAKEQLEIREERARKKSQPHMQANQGLVGLPMLFGLDLWIPRGNGNITRNTFENLRNNGHINVDALMNVIPQGLANIFEIESRSQRGFKFKWGHWHIHGHEPDTGAREGHVGGAGWIVRIMDGKDYLLSTTKISPFPVNHANYLPPSDWSHSKSNEVMRLSHIILDF